MTDEWNTPREGPFSAEGWVEDVDDLRLPAEGDPEHFARAFHALCGVAPARPPCRGAG